jgi:hypothetical protein
MTLYIDAQNSCAKVLVIQLVAVLNKYEILLHHPGGELQLELITLAAILQTHSCRQLQLLGRRYSRNNLQTLVILCHPFYISTRPPAHSFKHSRYIPNQLSPTSAHTRHLTYRPEWSILAR